MTVWAELELDDAACCVCRACEVVCSFHLTGAFDPANSAIRVNVNPSTGALLVETKAACDMCRDEPGTPKCIAVCPADAIRQL
jgi:Fe-S-cluster-containing hydrogenase component 2